MRAQDNGGQAFPCQPQWWDPDEMAYRPGDWVPGMTLRDYFAAKAMGGLVVNGDNFNLPQLAAYAYEMADAMLKARQA